MLPPPVPMAETSIMLRPVIQPGLGSFGAGTVVRWRRFSRPSTMIPVSKLVPPTSAVMILRRPMRAPNFSAPT